MSEKRQAAPGQNGAIWILEGLETIATVPASTRDKSQRAAEIVAFPQLLAACKTAIKECLRCEGKGTFTYGLDCVEKTAVCRRCKPIIEAVAAAKGETS